jgi:hypothetical protein
VNAAYRPASGPYPAYNLFDAGNLKITFGSPAVNAGEALPDVPDDFFGQARPASSGRYDIGAHSLSKPGACALTVTGLAGGTEYSLRARFRVDDGTYSDYSAAEAATTP